MIPIHVNLNIEIVVILVIFVIIITTIVVVMAIIIISKFGNGLDWFNFFGFH